MEDPEANTNKCSTTNITLSTSRPRSRSRPRLLQKTNREQSNERAATEQSPLRGRQGRQLGESVDSGIGYSPNSSAHYTRPQSLEAQFRQQFSCPVSTSPLVSPQSMSSKSPSAGGVAAYVLQADGTMAAVRWDDKSALESNAPVLAALKQEQQAQMHGRTAGRIQSANNSRAALPNDVLNWLATDDDVFSSSNGSERGRATTPKAAENQGNIRYSTKVRIPRAKSVEYRRPRHRQIPSDSSFSEADPTKQFEALKISGMGGVSYQMPNRDKAMFYQPTNNNTRSASQSVISPTNRHSRSSYDKITPQHSFYSQAQSPSSHSTVLTQSNSSFGQESTHSNSNSHQVMASQPRVTSSPARVYHRAASMPRAQSPQAFSYTREPRQLYASEITPETLQATQYVKPRPETSPRAHEMNTKYHYNDPYHTSSYIPPTEQPENDHQTEQGRRNGLRIMRSPAASQSGPAFTFNRNSYSGESNSYNYVQSSQSGGRPYSVSNGADHSQNIQEIEENSSANQVKQELWSPSEVSPVRVQRSPGYRQRELALDRVPHQNGQGVRPTDIPVWDRFQYYERCATSDF